MRGVYEEKKRSALKTISWRIMAISATMFLVYLFTGRMETALTVTIARETIGTVLYFVHERIWNRITFGRSLFGTIKSVMRSPPITALPSDTISSTVETMITSDIGAVIVREGNKLLGLITEKDILERVLEPGKDPANTFLGDIMSLPLEIVEHDRSLIDVLKIMQDRQIRRLAVIQEGEAIGIVTERRILEALI